jgi:hypothetical protein
MATGIPTITPTTITQASTTREPSMRLDRDEQSVDAAHSAAAPSPPMMAVTRSSVAAGPGRRATDGVHYHHRRGPYFADPDEREDVREP